MDASACFSVKRLQPESVLLIERSFVSNNSVLDDKPWWTYGHLWLVISGPVSVVLACLVTFYFIANSPNQILTGQDVEIENIKNGQMIEGRDAPAVMARNHAATGTVPAPKTTPELPK